MPIKKFADAEILTADDVNTYLMDQAVLVFENAAARDAAFSTVDPALPTRGTGGRLCYLKSTAVIQYWNGTDWIDSSSFTTPDDSITNAKVKTDAAIALSKLASGTSGQIIVANASGVPTYVTLSGDATISNTGVVSIGANNVALGTDTVGNYVATVTGTANQVTVSGSGSETAAVTLSLPSDINITNINMSGSASVATNLTVSGSTSLAGAVTAASASVAGNVVYHVATASVASGGSLSLSENGKLVELTGNSATLTVPNDISWTPGSQITVMQMGTGSAVITFTGASDIKAEPRTSASVITLRTKFSSVTLINRGSADWYAIGDLKA
jgi:hypothetical protein